MSVKIKKGLKKSCKREQTRVTDYVGCVIIYYHSMTGKNGTRVRITLMKHKEVTMTINLCVYVSISIHVYVRINMSTMCICVSRYVLSLSTNIIRS